MHYKKKIIIVIIFFILSIQIALLINNRQKTSFRYFIWNVEEVSIGRLVFISFMSGLFISSFLEKTINSDFKNNSKNNKYTDISSGNENSLNGDDSDESNKIPPERDLRDTQPTISVNYRVIKDYGENEIPDIKKTSTTSQYQDDWNNKELDW